jgi:hypothetical protein
LILSRWLALILVLAAGTAQARDPTAQARDPIGVEIVAYGIFRADIVEKKPDAAGVVHNVVANICQIATTRTVPARRGLHFGLRYRVTGPVTGARVVLGKRVVYPTTMTPPPPELPLSMVSSLLDFPVGQASYTDYAFEHPWELVPGTWTFQFFESGRKLAEFGFTVVEDDGGPLPGAEEATCFQIS